MRQLARYWRVVLVIALVLLAGLIGRFTQSGSMHSMDRSESAMFAPGAAGGMATGMPAPMTPQDEANASYDMQYREKTAASPPDYDTKDKSGQMQTITEDEIANLPKYQQDLLSNPGWNQPYIEPKPGAPPAEPGQNGSLPAPPAGKRSAIDEWFSPAAYAEDHKIDEKYIVRTGNLEIKTDSVKDSVQKINAVAEKYGGNVSDSSISKDDSGHHSGSVTLRVPSAKFREAFEDLAAIGEVINRNESSTDLGQDYVASVSHMKTLVAEQATLQKMLDEALAVQRSRGLGEAYSVLLDTERRLSEVTEELRAVGEHVNAMADQITRSTITVSLSENPTLPASEPNKFNWGIGATFKQAVRDLMTGTRDLVNGIIYFVVSLQWIWWLLLFFVGRWVWRWFLKQKGLAGGRPAGK